MFYLVLGSEEEEHNVFCSMRNGPVAIHCCSRYANQLESVRDVPMPNVEQVHHKLDAVNLSDDPVDFRRTSMEAFCSFSQGFEHPA